jgi:hypothetical protein
MRTTVDIDTSILKELKALQKKEGKSLGRLVSDLLAKALHDHREDRKSLPKPRWISRAMGARVQLADKEAVYAAMEQRTRSTKGAGKR